MKRRQRTTTDERTTDFDPGLNCEEDFRDYQVPEIDTDFSEQEFELARDRVFADANILFAADDEDSEDPDWEDLFSSQKFSEED